MWATVFEKHTHTHLQRTTSKDLPAIVISVIESVSFCYFFYVFVLFGFV